MSAQASRGAGPLASSSTKKSDEGHSTERRKRSGCFWPGMVDNVHTPECLMQKLCLRSPRGQDGLQLWHWLELSLAHVHSALGTEGATVVHYCNVLTRKLRQSSRFAVPFLSCIMPEDRLVPHFLLVIVCAISMTRVSPQYVQSPLWLHTWMACIFSSYSMAICRSEDHSYQRRRRSQLT